jgi:hypothetical protein
MNQIDDVMDLVEFISMLYLMQYHIHGNGLLLTTESSMYDWEGSLSPIITQQRSTTGLGSTVVLVRLPMNEMSRLQTYLKEKVILKKISGTSAIREYKLVSIYFHDVIAGITTTFTMSHFSGDWYFVKNHNHQQQCAKDSHHDDFMMDDPRVIFRRESSQDNGHFFGFGIVLDYIDRNKNDDSTIILVYAIVE